MVFGNQLDDTRCTAMVTIRLTRRGGKKTPFYHVVVTDSRKRQGGKAPNRDH